MRCALQMRNSSISLLRPNSGFRSTFSVYKYAAAAL